MNVTDLLSRLSKVRKSSSGWTACCPAHEDRNPSLSIDVVDGGKILMHCHAGCSIDAVCDRLRLSLADLRGTEDVARVAPAKRTKATRAFSTKEEASAAALRSVQSKRGSKWRLAFTYDYPDANGAECMCVLRFEPDGGGDKTFLPIARVGNWWQIRDPEGALPLYRLPSIATAELVVIVEGEKAADAGASIGLNTTTSAHGSNSAAKSDWTPVAGKTVVILPDNDVAGQKYAREVAQILERLDPSTRLTVVELPGLPEHGDIHDFVAGRRSEGVADDAIRVEIDALIAERLRADSKPKLAHDRSLSPHTSAEDIAPKEISCTDTKNAERLVVLADGNIRYCHDWKKWLVFDGKRWRIDVEGAVVRFSKRVAARVLEEAAKSESKDDREKLAGWAIRSGALRQRQGLIQLAEAEPGVPIHPPDMDRDKWLLNCSNGTLDLRTGARRAHRRDDYITKLVPVDFLADAACPRWTAFLEEILPDEEVRRFVQRLLGAALVGEIREQIVVFFIGEGSNGKSTLLSVIQATLGDDYAITASPDLLLRKRERGHPTELADLFGVRIAVCSEVGAARELDEALVKRLTGGDIISARRMKENFWRFEPTHHIFVAANHRPIIRGTDHAIWRRIVVVPFTVKVEDKDQNLGLTTELLAEREGILAWLYEGCRLWQAEGRLNPPEAVRLVVADYREEMDVLGQFIVEACLLSSNAKVGSTQLHEAFRAWCVARGEPTTSQRELVDRLKARQITASKSNGRMVLRGISLRAAHSATEARGGLGTHCGISSHTRACRDEPENPPQPSPTGLATPLRPIDETSASPEPVVRALEPDQAWGEIH